MFTVRMRGVSVPTKAIVAEPGMCAGASGLRRLGVAIGRGALVAAVGASAQGQDVKAFHPAGPLPSYEVATVKPADPGKQFAGTTMRRYISSAYGVPIPWGVPDVEYSGSQVIGGPAWIDKDKYDITGKAPDELRAAMQQMSSADRLARMRMMQQSLLAERFHLKVHFETREMAVFELLPAKGGLKIKPVEPPQEGTMPKPGKPGDPMPPGMMRLSVSTNGASVIDAGAATISSFTNALRGQSPEVAGRPVVDKTGFTGNFDLKDFRFLGQAPPQHGDGGAGSEPDVPSLSRALEEKLGVRMVPTKAQVEIVVIDSIDRPSEN